MARWRKLRAAIDACLADAPKWWGVTDARAMAAKWLRPIPDTEDAPRAERLRELAHASEQLMALRDHPGWASLVALKAQLQAVSTETSRRPPSSREDAQADRLRVIAAAEYWAIEGLFSSVNRVITQGQKARQLLKDLITK